MNENTIIGFLDQTSPQTTSNTQRLWSFSKPVSFKNTTNLRANTFGFYAINGNSVVDFKEHSKKEDVCEFLKSIRDLNPGKDIIVVLDNFQSHKANDTFKCACDNNIQLVFLPPYSPDLNPLEFIWKSVKRIISREFITSLEHLKQLIGTAFAQLSHKLSFAKAWIDKFIDGEYKYHLLGF